MSRRRQGEFGDGELAGHGICTLPRAGETEGRRAVLEDSACEKVNGWRDFVNFCNFFCLRSCRHRMQEAT